MPPKKGKQRSDVAPFVQKLWDALHISPDKEDEQPLLSWKPDGKSFIIHDERRLVEKFFNNIVPGSFHRNLNMYDFARVGNVVSHKESYFIRDQTDDFKLLKRIRRKDSRQSNADTVSESSGFSSEEVSSVASADPSNSGTALCEVTINPRIGPIKGGTPVILRNLPRLDCQFLVVAFRRTEVEATRQRKGDGWFLTTPEWDKPETVPVIIMKPDRNEVGQTQFIYTEDETDAVLMSLLNDNQLKKSAFCDLTHKWASEDQGSGGIPSNHFTSFGPPKQGGQLQSVEILRRMLYIAARIGKVDFIQTVFNTSADRVVFGSYKNRSTLPEHIAEANNHDAIAAYLRQVTERFSTKEESTETQSSHVNWRELAKAFEEREKECGLTEAKWRKPMEDDASETYFGDTEVSDSDKERSDSDSEFERIYCNDPTGISIHHVSGKEEEQLREGEILRPVDTGGDDMPSTFSEKKTDDSEDQSQAKFGQDKTEILPECNIPGKNRICDGEGDEASIFFSELHGTTSEKKGSEEWIQDPERDARKESEVVWESKYDDHESEPAMSYPLPEQMRLADIKDDKGVPVIIDSIRELYKVREGRILPVAWCQDFAFHVDDIFTKLRLVSKEKVRGTTFDEETNMTSIFKAQADCLKPRTVLIEGDPGMGKTTYCQKLAHDWATQRADDWHESFPMIEVLLLLRCRDVDFTSSLWDAIDDQVLPMDLDEEAKKAFFQFIRENQSKVLLVIDGLDEATASELPMLVTLVEGRTLPGCHIVLTSRPETGKKIRRCCDTLWEIVGFSKSDAADFIRKYYRGTDHLAEKLLQKLGSLGRLSELIRNPVMTTLLCVLFEDFEGALPNESLVYTELVLCILRRHEEKAGCCCSGDLMAVYKRELILLGRMAFLALREGTWYIEEADIGDISSAVVKFGFLSAEPGCSKRKPSRRYGFLHKSFQDFFAGLYLAFQILDGEMDCDTVVTDCMYNEELKGAFSFMSGIVASQSEETAVSLAESVTAHETLPLSNPVKKGNKEELKEAFSFMSVIVASQYEGIAVSLAESVTAREASPLSNPVKKGNKEELKEAFSFMSGIVASQSEETSVSLAESVTAREASPLSTPGNHGNKHQWSSIDYMSACSAGKAVQSKRQPINSYSWRPQRSLVLKLSQHVGSR